MREPSNPSSSRRGTLSRLAGVGVLALACISVESPCFAEDENAAKPKSPLSHEALFAPNTTFPYFEKCGKLDTNSPESFSPSNAAALAQFSMLSYVKQQEFIEDTLHKAGFEYIRFFDTGGTFAYLAENEDSIVITFRGTESGDLTDYLTDAKVIHCDFVEGGRAHTGFVQALDLVQDALDEELASRLEACEGEKSVWVTGHSLGAALATLYSIRSPEAIDAIYAIGSPRAVNRKLARELSPILPLFRIVNNNDLVTRVPGTPFYQHIGANYVLSFTGELVVDPAFSRIWKDRLKGHRDYAQRIVTEHWANADFKAIPSDSFADHSPRLYVEALLHLAQQED